MSQQTMTLLEMFHRRGLNPRKDEDIIKFINVYWTYDYDIDFNVLCKLKKQFVIHYLFNEIQYPELSFQSSLTPEEQWSFVLESYLRDMEDWYTHLYDRIINIDPYAFTEMETFSDHKSENESSSHSKGNTEGNSKSKSNSSRDSNTNNSHNSNSVTSGTTNDSSNGSSSNNSTTDSSAHTSDTSRNANGIGTMTGSPNSVDKGHVVVKDSAMADTLSDTNNHTTDSGATSEQRTANSASQGTTNDNGTSSNVSKDKSNGLTEDETHSKSNSESGSKGKGSDYGHSRTTGVVASKMNLQLKYIEAFRNINTEFVDNAFELFQTTYL